MSHYITCLCLKCLPRWLRPLRNTNGIFFRKVVDKKERKKDQMVKLEVVKYKEQGSLGLGRLKERNMALIGKWLWSRGVYGIPSFSADMGLILMVGIAT